MTAVEIADRIIDKLQEENRGILETLHKAQDTIKYSERQLAEKERIIKVLEERIRAGTDGILEMSNRQKELTIKHLEMQIQKLLKENEDLELSLEIIKSEICPKCETKLLLIENTGASKSYKPSAKSSSVLLQKKSSQPLCPNRAEKIIEHKDKRITQLSNEVKRLTKSEEELNNKLYRFNKLLPLSRLPPEAITDCLLQEIKLLESQMQNCDECSKHITADASSKVNKPFTSYASSNKANFSKSTDRFKKSAFSKPKTSRLNLPETDPLDATKFENEVLHKKLQQLCNGISELKRLFAFEGENLSHVVNSTANEYRSFKIKLKEIVNNLNEIVQNILSSDFTHEDKDDLGYRSDDKYVIDCLQQRLKQSLSTVTELENENKALKESLEKLKAQMMQQDRFPDYFKKSSERLIKSFSDSKCNSDANDIKKLQEIIKDKQSQLEAAESHISTCQKFIDELQANLKQATLHHSKLQHSPSNFDNKIADGSLEQENKLLKTQLNVSEKNIKTCESVIEQLQKEKKHAEDRNERLESELHEYKSKAVSEDRLSKFSETHTLKKFNQELQDKVKTLEETIKKLQFEIDLAKSKNLTSEALAQDKIRLQSKLDAAEKQINNLEKSVEFLQERLKTAEDERNKFETQLQELIQRDNIAEAYENDVMALKNDLILKEDENRELKEALHNLENKSLEMNHYRKSLHQEIEKLCKVLMENEESEDSERRKAIYKAAVLRAAKAVLRLDDNFKLKADDSDGSSNALDEMTHQIQVYLTEVSRIHELITSQDHERQEMLKEFFDADDDAALRLSSPRLFETHVQGQPASDDLQSSPNSNPLKPPDFPESERSQKATNAENDKFESIAIAYELKNVQEELLATKSVTNYLLSSCTRLEDLLAKERTERAKSEREIEVCQEIIKDLKAQLSSKNSVTKRLNQLIDWMRTKEFNDEMSLEQLKNEIQWLAEKATSTETELCQYKEENCKMKSELNSMKRELMNEKYEKAKTNNELKQLKMQILNSQTTILDDTPIT